jgi:hypothetical protein
MIDVADDPAIRAAIVSFAAAARFGILDVDEASASDVVLGCGGEPWLALRPASPSDAFDRLLQAGEAHLGQPLTKLDGPQRAWLILFMRSNGAFELREAVARLAASLGVCRGTIYRTLRSLSA